MWLLRVVFVLLQALIGFLALRRPPHRLLWYVRIGITEWGYWLVPLVPAPFIPAWRRWWSAPVAWGGAVAATLAAAPLMQALRIAVALPSELVRAFGPATPASRTDAPARPKPLVFRDLLHGLPVPAIQQAQHTYWQNQSDRLNLDLYRPLLINSRLPLIVVIHGGAWESGDSRQLPDLNRYLAARGYAVAAINYRLAPAYHFPAPLEDLRAALAYLRANATDLMLDTERVALIGRSAGAQIALQSAYTFNDAAIRAVVGFYGPTDLRFGYENPAHPAVIDSRGVIGRYLGGSPTELAATYTAASPLFAVGPQSPATLLIQGSLDEMVYPIHSRRLAVRLAQQGRPYFLLELPWGAHACDANLCGPSGQLSLYAIEHLLAARLG